MEIELLDRGAGQRYRWSARCWPVGHGRCVFATRWYMYRTTAQCAAMRWLKKHRPERAVVRVFVGLFVPELDDVPDPAQEGRP